MNSPDHRRGQIYGRRPPRKSNLFLLLIMGFMAFGLYWQNRDSSSPANPAGVQQQIVRPAAAVFPDISNDHKDLHASPAQNIKPSQDKNTDWPVNTDIASAEHQTEVAIGSRGTSRLQTGELPLESVKANPSQQVGEAK